MDVGALAPASYNPRGITDEAFEGLKNAIKRFGLYKPVVWNKRTERLVAGHQTLRALKELGIEKVHVSVVDVDEITEKAMNVNDNNPHIQGHFTVEVLDVLEEVQLAEPELLHDVGLDQIIEQQTYEITDQSSDEDEPDPEVPEPPDEPQTKPGDLYELGKHRLLCGDSASASDVDRLVGGKVIHLVNMDPPYNVKVEPRSNNAIAAGLSSFSATHHQSLDVHKRPGAAKGNTKKMRAKDRPLDNDFISDEAFDEMLLAWFTNASRVLKPGGSFYIWGGYANIGNYPGPLKAAGLYFSQGIVWDKMHPVLTRKDFMGAFEICFYGWKEGAGHKFYGPNNARDLWHVKKVNPQSMVHLTEKPVQLAVLAIEYSSKANENVLDLFGGSGSTLIACEKVGRRRAFLMELDPAYCDVIVQRWEELTGKKAKRIEG